jgi:hypothetical protein
MVCHPLSFNSLSDMIFSDNLCHNDDPHAQGNDFGGQSTVSSTSTCIDEQPDTQRVNDPSAVVEVVLAKTPCTYPYMSHFK